MKAKHLTINGQNVIRLIIDGKVFWKGLHVGYTALDYIESTGTQWIDTGFVPDQDTRVICEFMWLSGDAIYGTRQSTAARNYAFRAIGTPKAWQPGYSVLVTTGIKADTNWHTAEQDKNLFYLDGFLVAECEYTKFDAPKTFALGGINASNKMYYGQNRYRYCQIYNNGVLVRDLVPCKDPDGNIGMYDTLNAVFYGNAGTGEFVAGEITDMTSELGVATLGYMILGE